MHLISWQQYCCYKMLGLHYSTDLAVCVALPYLVHWSGEMSCIAGSVIFTACKFTNIHSRWCLYATYVLAYMECAAYRWVCSGTRVAIANCSGWQCCIFSTKGFHFPLTEWSIVIVDVHDCSKLYNVCTYCKAQNILHTTHMWVANKCPSLNEIAMYRNVLFLFPYNYTTVSHWGINALLGVALPSSHLPDWQQLSVKFPPNKHDWSTHAYVCGHGDCKVWIELVVAMLSCACSYCLSSLVLLDHHAWWEDI